MRKLKLENKLGNMREHMLATNCKDAQCEFDAEVCGKPRKVVIRIITETKRYDKMSNELIQYIADYYKCDRNWDVLGKHINKNTIPIILWIDSEGGKWGHCGLTKWTSNKQHHVGMQNYLLKLAGYPEKCKPYIEKQRVKA